MHSKLATPAFTSPDAMCESTRNYIICSHSISFFRLVFQVVLRLFKSYRIVSFLLVTFVLDMDH